MRRIIFVFMLLILLVGCKGVGDGNRIGNDDVRILDEQLHDIEYYGDYIIGFNDDYDIIVYKFSDEEYKRVMITGFCQLSDLESTIFSVEDDMVVGLAEH